LTDVEELLRKLICEVAELRKAVEALSERIRVVAEVPPELFVRKLDYDEIRRATIALRPLARWSLILNYRFSFAANEYKRLELTTYNRVTEEWDVFLPNELSLISNYWHSFKLFGWLDEVRDEMRLLEATEARQQISVDIGCHRPMLRRFILDATNLRAEANWLDLELYTCAVSPERWEELVERLYKPIFERIHGTLEEAASPQAMSSVAPQIIRSLKLRCPECGNEVTADEKAKLTYFRGPLAQTHANCPARWSVDAIVEAHKQGKLEKVG
jgi:hypothetical protein